MAEAVCFAPSDERGPWSAGPGALGPLSGTCPCFHNMGGRRPWGPSARGAWGPAGVLSPGGWFQVADCPPHTGGSYRATEGTSSLQAWVCVLARPQGARPDCRPATPHDRLTSVLSVLEADSRGQVSRSSGEDPACRLPCLRAREHTAPISASSPRAAPPMCLGPSPPEDTGHWVRSAPS